ncbi:MULTISPECIES: HupE/UreJ family protein [unclassified Phyllobacterium]|uniref:HupE/UreJ family protein n=1 Tax=Phyllobacterium TaxID=28100 RepID=UPI0015FD1EE3|nr:MULTISPECIES: HupE/UreJ family protein [unclassified Phyllobacterium]MBA8904076.1 urease accessory protein [Phyllobacterium sp. P30BS-XVII]UGX87685.1 HupE/UreJ family protein [Phyllobacterium sp. T1293]
MVTTRTSRIAVFSLATLYPALAHVPLAYAHVGVGETSGFTHGFAHPISGLDHVLAMILVGIFAFQLGGRALWLVPAAFVGMMAVGGALGVAGITMPFVELGIALSIIVLGAAVAFEVQAPVAIASGLVGLFAVFHGYAHGAEMPESAGGLAYAGGFMAATALLHIAGIGIGFAIGKIGQRVGPNVVRLIGGLAALAGIGILTGTL